MNKYILKLTSVILTISMVLTLFFSMGEKANAEYDSYPVSGVSSAISLSILSSVASIQTRTYVMSTMASENTSVNSELIQLDENGNKTVCGYTNLGIIKVKGNLNVRETASKNGKILGKITNNCGCEVYEFSNGWVRIESGNLKGWVSEEYILTGDDAFEAVEKSAMHVIKVTTDTLRVRTEPNTDSAIMTTVSKGELLEIEDEENGWYKITVDSDEGWVSGDYCSESYELSTGTTISEMNYGSGTSSTRISLVQFALKYVGGRYVWGGTSLSHGVDCSGFVMCVYAHFGISLPHYSGSQAGCGVTISASSAQPGDLFFYGNGGHISHVGIYIGNGQIVHASSPSTGIKISSAYYRTPIKVVRILSN